MKKINIAIDGYAACGKSTTAKQVAKELNYIYIDTGAMYRAITLYVLEHNLAIADSHSIINSLSDIEISFEFDNETAANEILLNNRRVKHLIRSESVNQIVSEVSAIKEVRQNLVEKQKLLGQNKGVVMDGRDIGTVVLPDAELKIFMYADIDTRVKRRIQDLREQGTSADEIQVRENLEKRDYLDTHRTESPLKKAPEAREINTTDLSFEKQVELVVSWAKELIFDHTAILK